VLVALGFIDLSGGQVSLTPAGREFVDERDIELVRQALCARIVGVKELLAELEDGPRTTEQLQQLLGDLALAWETNAQVGWRLHWLESVKLIVAHNGKYQLLEPQRSD